MNGMEESSVLEFLDNLIEDTPQVQRAGRRERLRLELAKFMKKARETAGLTQQEVAEALSVTQAWVSKLESPNYDHKLESVLSYFDAIGGEMNLSVDVADSTFQIWGVTSEMQLPTDILSTENNWHDLIPSRANEYSWDYSQQVTELASTTHRESVVVTGVFDNTQKMTMQRREANAI